MVAVANRMTAWKSGAPLPYDEEVEWLESPSAGGLMAVIPYYLSQSTRVVIDGYVNGSSAERFVGTRGNGTDCMLGYSNRYYWAGKYTSDGFNKFSRHLIDFGSSLSVDGVKIAESEGVLTSALPNPIGLFGCHNYNTTSPIYGTCKSFRCYSCRVYEGEELMIDLIPVKVNGVGMMFDRLNGGRFIEVVGTGVFVIGPNKT